MERIIDMKRLVLRDTSFAQLMNKRIFNVLLIATRYDAFMLEDDGRIDEQLFNEYTSLGLRYPPRFTQVATEEEAIKALENIHFELVICMPNMDNADTFATANHIKSLYADIPIIVLTPFFKEVSRRLATEDVSAIDYVFSWLGNAELLLAMIKLLEDRMNVDDDVDSVGVQTILLVEDSVRFISSALPLLYKFVLRQSREFAKEALNAHQQTLRMRGRPKILLARTYEEAEQLYDKYKHNMLGIISDMSFNRQGQKDEYAGYKFGCKVRNEDRFVPIVFNSSDASNKTYADELGSSFVWKTSKTFPQDLRKEVSNNFGFGDFIIINPTTRQEVMRVTDLKDLQIKIFDIPEDSLIYHLSNNHFSRFFYSRAIFPIADFLKDIDVSDYKDMKEARQVIFEAIVSYRKMKNAGVVAVFEKDRFDEYSNFARIGEDSLGGKGRGLAFLGQMIKRHTSDWEKKFAEAIIRLPKTVVLTTDIFDEFMEHNNLYEIALQDLPDQKILNHFLDAVLPKRLVDDLLVFFDVVKTPIAVRSSSLLEDAHYQPFAGIYSTYMVPQMDNPHEMLRWIGDAIKGVYASVFFKDSKAYMTATQNLIDQEKMAIVLQEVVGAYHDDRFYPDYSGVARSLNFYPVNEEKPGEGIVNVALGLGKYIVDGGVTLRFSPKHPHKILQTSTLELALKDTQKQFYALNLKALSTDVLSTDDAYNYLTLSIKDAEKDGTLQPLASTYDANDQTLMDGYYPDYKRYVITFANALQNESFPLAKILSYVLTLGQKEMGRPVEIEFAVSKNVFYLLQIRPIVDNKMLMEDDLTNIPAENLLLSSNKALGHGIYNDIYDVVYVKTATFNSSNNEKMVPEIEALNRQLVDEGRNYVLIAPGRWGSSDPSLGIPVKWSQISNARLIVESGLENYRIEPSQGTHFFQNLTSFGVGYFTINPFLDDGFFDEAYLNAQPAVSETAFLRHVRFTQPAIIKIAGRKNLGVVEKP
ncbi:phosphoenolpyruvate synthase [Bacteroidia bacterium]|nr:phosphoenolpyruvate synthase [Bacteroidia bacterium]